MCVIKGFAKKSLVFIYRSYQKNGIKWIGNLCLDPTFYLYLYQNKHFEYKNILPDNLIDGDKTIVLPL